MPTLHDDIPPLPKISNRSNDLPSKSTRRSTSMDFTHNRVSSPTPRRQGGRAASLDRAAKNLAKRASGTALASGPARPSSTVDVSPQRSVNFSYPISPANSPPASPLPEDLDEDESVREPEIKPVKATRVKETDISKSGNNRSTVNGRKTSRDASALLTQGKKSNEQLKSERNLKGPADRDRPLSTAAAAAVVASRPSTHNSSAAQEREMDYDRQTLTGSPQSMLWRKPSVVEELDEEADSQFLNSSLGKKGSGSQGTVQRIRPKSAADPSPVHAKASKSARPTSATASMIRNGNKAVQAKSTANRSNMNAKRVMRPQSLSPARSAHFSNVTVLDTDGTKHEPPPRSFSPSKSVLKHSPSSSLANNSPTANHFVTRNTLGNVSDTLSDDVQDIEAKRKKKVRVNFDKDAVQAANGNEGAALPKSPHPLGLKKKFSDERRSSNDDWDDILKPSPELPSFGSVRTRRTLENESDSGDRGVETGSSSISDSMSTLVEPTGISSDKAAGAVFMQNQVAKTILLQNAPKSTTPKSRSPNGITDKGVDNISDLSSGDHNTEESKEVEHIAIMPTSDVHVADEKIISSPDQSLHLPDKLPSNVPAIALQPATPAAMEDVDRISAAQGSFTDKAAEAIKFAKEQEQIGSRESTPTPTLSKFRSTESNKTAPSLESEDSGNETTSIYSDAAEDVQDYQEAGFVSLDAIVEKPVPSSESIKEKKSLQVGKKISDVEDRDRTNTTYDDPVERKGTPMHHIHWGSNESIPQLNSFKQNNMQKRSSISSTGTNEVKKPALKSALKNSDRRNIDYENISKDMIANRQVRGMHTSMRPSSPQFSESSRRPSKPRLLRGFSSDSDSDASESSFKRSRVSSSVVDGQYSMRRSMRAPSPAFSDRPASVASTGGRYKRASLRPQSPERPSTAQSMRTTLRGSRDTGSSLRKQTVSPGWASGFAKAQKPKSKASHDRFRSRFADSSDEEDAKQRMPLQSRFDDSDDEDSTRPRLAPVRSIPRQSDIPEGDSTDLPDTEDEDKVPPMRNMTPRNAKAHSLPPLPNGSTAKHTQGAILASGSLRSNASSRGTSRQNVGQPNQANGILPTKHHRHHSLSATLGFHKSAKHATADSGVTTPPIQSPALPGSPATTRSSVSTSRLRLRKPGFFHRKNKSTAAAVPPVPPIPSAAWPLPENYSFASSKAQRQNQRQQAASFTTTVSGAGGMPERPQTSDGATGITSPASVAARMPMTGAARPPMARRTSTAMTATSAHGTVVSMRTGKNKKFPKLRKAFGLVD